MYYRKSQNLSTLVKFSSPYEIKYRAANCMKNVSEHVCIYYEFHWMNYVCLFKKKKENNRYYNIYVLDSTFSVYSKINWRLPVRDLRLAGASRDARISHTRCIVPVARIIVQQN